MPYRTIVLALFITVVPTQLAWSKPPYSRQLEEPVKLTEQQKLALAAQKSIDKGNALVEKGKDRLEDGQEQINKGNDLIKDGTIDVEKSRKTYRKLVSEFGSASSSDDVEDEAKQLRKIASKWEDAEDDVDDGKKLVKKGEKTVDRAQSEIREGRAMVDTGERQLKELAIPIDNRLEQSSSISQRTGPSAVNRSFYR